MVNIDDRIANLIRRKYDPKETSFLFDDKGNPDVEKFIKWRNDLRLIREGEALPIDQNDKIPHARINRHLIANGSDVRVRGKARTEKTASELSPFMRGFYKQAASKQDEKMKSALSATVPMTTSIAGTGLGTLAGRKFGDKGLVIGSTIGNILGTGIGSYLTA